MWQRILPQRSVALNEILPHSHKWHFTWTSNLLNAYSLGIKTVQHFEALILKHLYTKYIRHSKLLQQATILVFSPQSLYGKSTTETLKLRLQLQPHVSTTFSSPFPVQLKTQSSELFKHVLKPMLPWMDSFLNWPATVFAASCTTQISFWS